MNEAQDSWLIAGDAWAPLVSIIGSRLGMYTAGTFTDACSLLVGFGLARADSILDRFTEWVVVTRPPLAAANVAFPALVCCDALGKYDGVNWRDLSPEDDALCVQHLSRLLGQFLADDQFVKAWVRAGEALRKLNSITTLSADVAAIVTSDLDSSHYVRALPWFESAYAKSEPTPTQADLLAVARAGLSRRG